MNNRQAPQLASIKGLIIDMDGVLWHGPDPLPGLARFFATLRRRGMRFVLATNNNTMAPEGFVEKAKKFGVEVARGEIVTASLATISYLKDHFDPGAPVYVIGEPPFKKMIAEAGYSLAGRDAVAVVAALDRSLTYEMLKTATLLIRAGAAFIGPNPDACYPAPEGMIPGSGAVLSALATSTGRRPTIIGKPEKWVFQSALKQMGIAPRQAASLGDRLDTDILGGKRVGMNTILVLSGVTTAADLAASRIQPTWVFSGIDELARSLEGVSESGAAEQPAGGFQVNRG